MSPPSKAAANKAVVTTVEPPSKVPAKAVVTTVEPPSKVPAKAIATTVEHGPSPKAKYKLPAVIKQENHGTVLVSGSPIKKHANEETIMLHHVVTDHGILTVYNKNGESGFINNLRNASMTDRVKEKMNLIGWKCHRTVEDRTIRMKDRNDYPWLVAVVKIEDGKNDADGGRKILQDWVRLGNSPLVTRLNERIANVFLMGSDLTPSEDDFLGNHLIEKDTLDVIQDVYVGYPDSMIEAEPAIMKAYFGGKNEAHMTSKESNGSGSNVGISDADVTAFLASLDNVEP